MEFKLTKAVTTAIDTLEKNGYKAYLVGGAVRDFLMGKTPSDFDVTTSALPDEIASAFKGYTVLGTGLKHGTVTVIIDGESIEITTFRKDGEYLDGRRPESVKFGVSLKEDLSRRDFTVNALAYNVKTGIIDYYGGIDDIKNKIIRTVGNSEERFKEDGLRILRAVRFSSKLGFKIEEETYESSLKLKSCLNGVSAERKYVELKGIITGDFCLDALLLYREIIFEIIPELKLTDGFLQHSKWHKYDVYEHIVRATASACKDEEVRLATLLHDIEKPSCFFMKNGEGHFYGHGEKSSYTAIKILRRLKASNKTVDSVSRLIKYHDRPIKADRVKIKRLLNELGENTFFKLMEVKIADNSGQGTEIAESEIAEHKRVIETAREITDNGECFSLKQLKIDGDDLKNLGIVGESVGKTLEFCLSEVISGNLKNEREQLLNSAVRHERRNK